MADYLSNPRPSDQSTDERIDWFNVMVDEHARLYQRYQIAALRALALELLFKLFPLFLRPKSLHAAALAARRNANAIGRDCEALRFRIEALDVKIEREQARA